MTEEYTKEEIKKRIGIKSDNTFKKYIILGKIQITQAFSREKKLYAFSTSGKEIKQSFDMDFCEKN